jgi:hypothetical protein
MALEVVEMIQSDGAIPIGTVIWFCQRRPQWGGGHSTISFLWRYRNAGYRVQRYRLTKAQLGNRSGDVLISDA